MSRWLDLYQSVQKYLNKPPSAELIAARRNRCRKLKSGLYTDCPCGPDECRVEIDEKRLAESKRNSAQGDKPSGQ